jgi:hypothetical protein
VVSRMMAKPDVIAGFIHCFRAGGNRDVEAAMKSSRDEQPQC